MSKKNKKSAKNKVEKGMPLAGTENSILKRFAHLGIPALSILTVLNLLIYNDANHLYDFPELAILQNNAIANPIPAIFSQVLFDSFGLDMLWLRMPSVVLALLGIGIIYLLGRRLFGEEPARMAAIIISSSFAILSFGKLINSDIYLYTVQLLQFFTLLYYLKKNRIEWGVLFVLLFLVGIVIAPITQIVFSSILILFYAWKHPQGRHLIQPIFIGLLAISGLLAYALGNFQLEGTKLVLSWWSGAWKLPALWNVLALSVYLPFLVSGLVDSFKKLRNKEEMAIVYWGAMLAALCSGGLFLQFIFAVIAGRHFLYYFQKNYPYKTLTRGLSVLNLILAFFGFLALIFWSGVNFPGYGYRAAISIAIAYWAGSMGTVISLFGDRKRNALVSLVFATSVTFLMFCLNGLPLIEYKSGASNRVLTQALKFKTPLTEKIYFVNETDSLTHSISESAHFAMRQDSIQVDFTALSQMATTSTDKHSIFLLPSAAKNNFNQFIIRDSVIYFQDLYADQEWYYIAKWK